MSYTITIISNTATSLTASYTAITSTLSSPAYVTSLATQLSATSPTLFAGVTASAPQVSPLVTINQPVTVSTTTASSPQTSSTSTATVAGAAVGGLVLVLCLIAIYCCYFRDKAADTTQDAEAPQQAEPFDMGSVFYSPAKLASFLAPASAYAIHVPNSELAFGLDEVFIHDGAVDLTHNPSHKASDEGSTYAPPAPEAGSGPAWVGDDEDRSVGPDIGMRWTPSSGQDEY